MDFFFNSLNKIAHLYLFYSIFDFISNNKGKNNSLYNIFNNDKLVKYTVSMSIKAIEYYSIGEIYLNKLKKRIKVFIDSNPELKNFIQNFNKNKITENVEFIHNGDIVNKMTLIDFIENYNYTNSDIQQNTDFCIYSDYNNENEVTNKIIIRDYENFVKKHWNLIENQNQNQSQNVDYCEAGYKFIMFEIIINDISISVDMTTEKYNYLIIDNVFDSNFIKYFLKKYHNNIYNKLSDNDLSSYKIKIIDHNINVLEFTNKPVIICREKGITYLNNDEDKDGINSLDSQPKNSKYDLNDEYDCIEVENYKYN